MNIRLKNAADFEEQLIRNGYSKRSFAEAAGIGQVTVLQIVNGDRRPSPRIAKRICEALEVEFDDIFVIERSPATPKTRQAAAK
jgi:DNA-binding XRE family transcriptional regulator